MPAPPPRVVADRRRRRRRRLPAELLDAVRAVASGQTWFGLQAAKALAEQYRRPPGAADDPYEGLTREREVLHLVAEDKTTKEIGKTVDPSPEHRIALSAPPSAPLGDSPLAP